MNKIGFPFNLDRKKVFGDTLVASAKGTIKRAAELITSPIETSKSMQILTESVM